MLKFVAVNNETPAFETGQTFFLRYKFFIINKINLCKYFKRLVYKLHLNLKLIIKLAVFGGTFLDRINTIKAMTRSLHSKKNPVYPVHPVKKKEILIRLNLNYSCNVIIIIL